MEHFPVRLQGSEKGFALLARKPPESAVVFVHGFGGHGFGGSPTTTWVGFEHLIDQLEELRAEWSRFDLFFYGYRSHNQIAPLGEDLVRFISAVAARNERLTLQIEFALPSSSEKMYGSSLSLSLARGTDPYKSLFLVGHSTGALLIREAVLLKLKEIASSGCDLTAWFANALRPVDRGYADQLVARAFLRFFAPAHLGVMAAGLLGAASSLPRIEKIVEAYLRCNPLYQNLRPGSPTLVDLRKETETLYEKHKIQALKALSVFGDKEDVVFIGSYCHDEQLPTERGHTHTSICKPTRQYVKPLEFVTHASALARRV
jgi:pimeloyl-ACP methyl ester carboxylesterase